jgi:hyperosmotically inducible periplasmic protein
MLNKKSSSRLILTNALLMSLAMGTIGLPMAMAADVKSDEVKADATMDKKTTAYETSQTPVSDTWITTKVKADFLADEDIKGLDINVSTTNGVVTLAGVLDSQALVDKTISVTKAIKGVKSVETKALKVKPAM